MPFIVVICTSVKAVIDTTESCTFSIMELILTIISMQLLKKKKKSFIKTEGKKNKQKTTSKTKPNRLKEDDSTTVASLFSPVIRIEMFIIMRTDREVLALFHPP